ncbi:MAG: acyl-CoA thioesterase [Clostridia bacterium]|nr:acyl-CoA thioesterase [Clostridia bacterium]
MGISMKEIKWCHKVQYYETDQMGIAHHSNYIRWFEEARVYFLDEIGFSFRKIEESGIVCPVTSVSCEYKKMSHFEDNLIIVPVVESFNGVKMTIRYEITDEATNELRAIGKSGHCFLDRNGYPLRLKKTHPEFYELMMSCVECND